ncbi:TetR/AcrR family transcriptional regulator [Planomonospora sp. ID82291]|uniref:TetR/AcrR family transcriptional regulator n=1 Tax=Planomonospora sp. ID82291 TaxID=2738136 RepID=UPI0018C44D89|nr:TetR/AcrR family transcriptional regulator [Planomonospora sp. ID82291]MBG0817554.1 TetR/AcrR family transcriptional regulator [Planomonospora sp. ID82291]
MASEPRAAGGPSRRRPRLSDQETRRRMLDAALATVHRDGLTVGLDHIGFEEVIRHAGVSRAAVYRRWPYKDLFFGDLLRELAQGAAPAAAVTEEAAMRLLGSVLAGREEALASPQGRHDLVTEMLRVSASSDFEAVHGSAEWRTYLALQATFLSLPDGDLRDDVQAALARSEARFVDRVARGWERIAGAMGYRLRPGSGGSFPVIATLAGALMRGLVLMALSDPGLPARRVPANPVGASAAADWPLIGLAAAGIAGTFLEPDPDVVWDDERVASLRALLGRDVTGDAAGPGR